MIRAIAYRREAGETLIEILVAIAILGIGATGLITALSTGIVGTEGHRRLSDAEKVARAYGELVKNKVLHAPSTTLTQNADYTGAGDVVLHVVSTAGFQAWDPDPGPCANGPCVAMDGTVFDFDSLGGGDAGCTNATCMTVTPEGGGTSTGPWTDASGSHHLGSTVTAYEPCPTAWISDAKPGFFDPTNLFQSASPDLQRQLSELVAPTTGNGVVARATSIKWYNKNGQIPTTCSAYHSSNFVPCNAVGDWRTSCDPPYMRVTVTVVSTDQSQSTGTKPVSTDVLIRRVV